MKSILFLLLIFCLSCASDKSTNEKPLSSPEKQLSSPHKKQDDNKSLNSYKKLTKLSVTGDFDGDGKQDTLYQQTINGMNGLPIDSVLESPWDTIEFCLLQYEAEVILTLSKRHYDTLNLGFGGGLYCLINIGDTNNDHKDEIALVVNTYNFSNISQCQIFTICKDKWISLKEFEIHEQAFYYTDADYQQINGFLEYRRDKWFYIDYMDWFNAENAKDTVLKPLRIKKGC